ncbi:MAG: hypothetical protein LBJ99_01175 [Oscillospiraceae bacterium]|nr:hypothetical protein [Oscillospiraceae bacterium]
MSRSVKISVYLLFFLTIAAAVYIACGTYIADVASRVAGSTGAGDARFPFADALKILGLLAGDAVLSYTVYYAVCYRNKKKFPIFISTPLLLALTMYIAVNVIYRAAVARALPPAPPELGTRVLAAMYGAYGAAAAVAIAVVVSIVRNVGKILRSIDELTVNGRYSPSQVNTGDELHALSLAVNALTGDVVGHHEVIHGRRDSYLRFIPEHFLALMGCDSVERIDREMTASRTMAVISVRFHIVTEHGDDAAAAEVFRKINAVTGRIMKLVGESGGTVFHFTHDGFEAVFESAPPAVSVSVAIRQIMLSELNYGALRIGIDAGRVMLGVVGDERRITPTIVSEALLGAQDLVRAAKLLEAGILCSETVANLTEGYSIRYIGKCESAGKRARVCEIFDGDEYDLRKEKQRLQREFNEALLTFYGGGYAQAKRLFLNIVRQCPGDGANRYYLYQSDKFEIEPPDAEFAIR